MAYAAAITVVQLGGGDFLLTIDETEASTADEATIVLATYGLPIQGRVTTQACALAAGSGMPGATINPILATVAGSTSGPQVVVENDTAAVSVSNEAPAPVPYYAPAGSLFHRSRCSNLVADHTIQTTYTIRRGWVG